MATLSEIISRRPTPEAKNRNKGILETLSKPIDIVNGNPFSKFELETFNFLLEHTKKLGIRSVIRLKALLIDGVVDLIDGKRLTVEIKYRMNWLKACQAEWQFRTFLKRHKAIVGPVDGGLVIFEEFSGDWSKLAPSRLRQNGWNHWYRGHSEVDEFHLDLVRLHDRKLETFHDAKHRKTDP